MNTAGRIGAQAQSQPDTLSWRVCAEQQAPGAGDAGETGERQQAQSSGWPGGANASSASCGHGRFLLLQNRHTLSRVNYFVRFGDNYDGRLNG